jgi:hypothetical protein
LTVETVNVEQPNVLCERMLDHVVLLGEDGLIFAIENFGG